MATQLTRVPRRRRPFAAHTPVSETRHPAVALAIAVPCAVLLLVLFGGWEQLATQTKAVADLIGR
ncbi:hypothetical protein [Kitasatospora camelliae]|uniref:Uncharacterized protein n=1 Tax=Kitasatospora camelliae TaxID=3156397 RepID=A0AAU8K320_9ACTN